MYEITPRIYFFCYFK